MSSWHICVDVGGTFSDFFAFDRDQGTVRLLKLPSTPRDPSDAILSGIAQIVAPGDTFVELRHGTTVALNALLEGKGAKVALVTTCGFRDLIEIGRQTRPDMYDLQRDMPPPLVPRERRFELPERTDAKGEVITDPTPDEIEAVVDDVRASGVHACAVAFLFSFLNPTNEKAMAAALSERLPDLHVSTSSDIIPQFREYERFSTTVLNAYVQPVVERYFKHLRKRVADISPDVNVLISQSNGGLMTIEQATRYPVRTALSGPAAGITGASAVARQVGAPNVITLDMGGTSTDVCLIRDYRAEIAIGRLVGSYPVRLPMIDINTIGAGGGSKIWIDTDGLLKVGPQSAGATPGPASYGTGGVDATVTDANVVLGRLPTTGLLGGGMPLDRQAAWDSFQPAATHLSMTTQAVASGVIEIVVSNMVRAIRSISVERGHDPKEFALMPFGGAGPLHASDVARQLGMKSIIVPPTPGILCAQGLVAADLSEEFFLSHKIGLSTENAGEANARLVTIVAQATTWVKREAGDPTTASLDVSLDVRYVGQNFELKVELWRGARFDDDFVLPPIEKVRDLFFTEHERAYGYFNPSDPIEIVGYRLTARVPTGEFDLKTQVKSEIAADVRHRPVGFNSGETVETRIVNRAGLSVGDRLDGPAIIEQLDTTFVLFPGDRLTVLDNLALLVEIQ